MPQGSVLGPLLFCLYIRSVPSSIFLSRSMSQLYVDDITFYTSSESIDTLCDTLSSDLGNLNNYLCERSLLLNPLKTQFLVISKPSQSIPCATSIHLNTTVIPAVSEAKYLGVIIDSHLTFKGQVESVCRSIEKKLGAYRRGRKYLSHTARRMFYISVIQTSLTYASIAYVHSLTQHLYDRVIIKGHLAMKTVFGLHRRTPTAFVLSHANLSPIELRYNFKLCLFTYRCLNHLSSTLLQSLFVLRTNTTHTDRITRGQVQAMLTTPHANSRYGYFSLSFLAADRWNLLPIAIRQAASMPDFHALSSAYLGLSVRSHRLLGDPLKK